MTLYSKQESGLFLGADAWVSGWIPSLNVTHIFQYRRLDLWRQHSGQKVPHAFLHGWLRSLQEVLGGRQGGKLQGIHFCLEAGFRLVSCLDEKNVEMTTRRSVVHVKIIAFLFHEKFCWNTLQVCLNRKTLGLELGGRSA